MQYAVEVNSFRYCKYKLNKYMYYHSGLTSLETIVSVGTFCSIPEAMADKFLTSTIMSFKAASIIPTLNMVLNEPITLFNPIASKPDSNCIMASISLVAPWGTIPSYTVLDNSPIASEIFSALIIFCNVSLVTFDVVVTIKSLMSLVLRFQNLPLRIARTSYILRSPFSL